jgi:hypothetical protein
MRKEIIIKPRFKITSLDGRFELRRGTHPKSPGFYLIDKNIKGSIKIKAVFSSYGLIELAKSLINFKNKKITITQLKGERK